MHPMERQFRREIVANPKDDVVRLVFADWLSDQGQEAHADMIRVQVELAQRRYKCEVTGKGSPSRMGANPSCCRTCELWCRDMELRKRVVYPTTNKLSQKGINLKHARGFVCSASMDLGDWSEIGALMVRLHPLEGGVKITDKRPRQHGTISSSYTYGWFVYPDSHERDLGYLAEDDLPRIIWDMLTGFTGHTDGPERGGWKHYDDIGTAMNCLQAAALQHAWTQPDPITTD